MFTRSMACSLVTAAAVSLSVAAAAQTTGGTNPPGTAAGRALDRAAGTDTSGAYPSQRDGTRANPPGTAAGRAFDRAAGTDTSGAYPSQSNGTPGNPPGTVAGRALNRAATPNR